tara:strand:- start:2598 stop:2888 length:291 start_codon:yes stop_codon:yes gene_type:complete
LKATYITEKSFRYRNGGEERNRRVLVTAQNQNTLRGFDITNMSDANIEKIAKSWKQIQRRKCSLIKKESLVLKDSPSEVKSSFRSYKTSKIRYFHA